MPAPINQLSTANTFQHWLQATQELIERQNYYSERTDLILESSNLIFDISVTANDLFDTANAVFTTANTIANTSNLVFETANTISNTANDVFETSIVVAATANTVAEEANNALETLAIINSTIVAVESRVLTAGNGLTGGGDLTANRTFTLGTPGTLTTSTTNSTTATSHTHAVNFPVTAVAGKTGAVTLETHTRGTGLTGSNYNGSAATTWAVAYGTTAGTACEGNDSRLSNARQATNTDTQVTSLGVGTAASGTSGEIRATNNITAYYSDDRLKTKLGNIESALEKLCSLDGFYYEANETAQDLGYDKIKDVGVSAQQVQKVLPEIVVPAPIDDKYLTVRYERMVPLLIEAIKELKQELDSLKGK